MSPRQAYRMLNRLVTVYDTVLGKTFKATFVQVSKGQLITDDGKAYDFANLESAPEERHNDEFVRLMDSSGMTIAQVAAAMDVSFYTVQSWRRPAGSKTAYACSAERVEQFKKILKNRKSAA